MAGKTVLIVDDDTVFQTSLTDILNRAGYDAHGTSNGGHAIRIAEALGKEIDLIVLEMNLPDMIGVAVIEAIAFRQKRIIKVVASSSVFSQERLNTQTDFPANAGIKKEATGKPAIAATWLQIVRGLLGELSEAAPTLRHDLILLVDDDPAVRHLVRTILNREGYQVLEAADGNNALTLVRKLGGAIDLVVTDIEMPGMGGRALAKAIRETYSNVPVIYISGFTLDDELNQILDPEHGFAFIGKPFQPKVLLETVGRLMDETK